MCVAAVIETEAGPTSDELRQMHNDNPHGAGVAFVHGGAVRYHKAVTWQWIAKNQARWPRPYLLHFRWATHGGRARHLAHPFPISISAVLSRKLSGECDRVLIHNGIWNNYHRFLPHWLRREADRWSDTAVAAYAAKVYGDGILDDVDWSTAVGRFAGIGRMDVTMRGRWTEYNGNMYSNLNWQPGRYTRMYGDFDWEDWNDWRTGSGQRASWRPDGKLVEVPKPASAPSTRPPMPERPCTRCQFYFCKCTALQPALPAGDTGSYALTDLNPDTPIFIEPEDDPGTQMDVFLDNAVAASALPKEKP